MKFAASATLCEAPAPLNYCHGPHFDYLFWSTRQRFVRLDESTSSLTDALFPSSDAAVAFQYGLPWLCKARYSSRWCNYRNGGFQLNGWNVIHDAALLVKFQERQEHKRLIKMVQLVASNYTLSSWRLHLDIVNKSRMNLAKDLSWYSKTIKVGVGIRTAVRAGRGVMELGMW